jgi:DNA-binding NarL/FixJ family response regulator
MIRVAIVDDHPALRAGLTTVLDAEPGLVVAGVATNREQLFPMLRRSAPDVVLLDYHLPDGDGLVLCRQIKHVVRPPRVIVYSAYANDRLRLAALVAGADGALNKSAPARELFDAIRRVARGERLLGPPRPETLALAARDLGARDAALLAMLIHGTPPSDVASVLGESTDEIEARIGRILQALHVRTPAQAA